MLVAAPAVAADPKADYKATFDACVGVGSADFEDVPANHANMGDIDCIAYYGITKGTGDGTTYSPLMSVTREHMALFLVRLAGRVGIAVASDPSDPGFTDTGDLSEESQTAIAQLADLGITKGTGDGTTYSPADNVSRAHMALFIARLMDKITPAADGEVGLSSTTQHGYTPANVAKNAKEADIGSPFTDLGQATKDEYDAITHLYELGVASGISATSYSPSSDMTRAAMAEFMAAVMDHSNLRPAGLSIQASPTTSWGAGSPTVVVSVRDDMFMAVEDQAVDVFSSAAENNGLRNDGTCNFATNDDVLRGSIEGDCVWNDNDDATDADGNLFTSGEVEEGNTRVFYAWIGSKNGDKFDADTADAATVSVSAKAAQASLKVSSTINKNADTTYDGPDENTTPGDDADALGAKVDLRAVSSVTFSAQLKDSDGANVARSGVSVRVEYKQDDSYQNTHEATLTTDDAGMVSFPVNGPSNGKGDDSRADEIIFTELDANGAKTMRTDTGKVYWVEETPVITDSALEVADYLMDGSSISVGA
nr:S-layer homology domain-containing protein [bacterium]